MFFDKSPKTDDFYDWKHFSGIYYFGEYSSNIPPDWYCIYGIGDTKRALALVSSVIGSGSNESVEQIIVTDEHASAVDFIMNWNNSVCDSRIKEIT